MSLSSACRWPGPCSCTGSVIARSVQHVHAGAASVALLLSCVGVVELWPRASVRRDGSALRVSGLAGFGAHDIALWAGPPRRLRTSYETTAHWTVRAASPGRAVLRVSPDGTQGARLHLDIAGADDVHDLQLRPAADLFLAELARAAEARALAG